MGSGHNHDMRIYIMDLNTIIEKVSRVMYCSTKKFAGDDAIKTTLTVTFKNWTLGDFINHAAEKSVVPWQGTKQARKADGEIPATAEYFPNPPGKSTVPLTIEEQIERLSDKQLDEFEALIAARKAAKEVNA